MTNKTTLKIDHYDITADGQLLLYTQQRPRMELAYVKDENIADRLTDRLKEEMEEKGISTDSLYKEVHEFVPYEIGEELVEGITTAMEKHEDVCLAVYEMKYDVPQYDSFSSMYVLKDATIQEGKLGFVGASSFF